MQNNPEFDDIINKEWSSQYTDPNPYGNSPRPAVKPGLTKRGKTALVIGATVLAGGSLLTWQHYSSEAEASKVRSQELAIEQQRLELEKLKVINETNAKNAQVQATQDASRQKQIDACVDTNKGLVGKQFGATYASVLEDCQNQYAATSTGADIQEAASATDASTGGGGVNEGVLIGGGVLILGLVVAGKRITRSN